MSLKKLAEAVHKLRVRNDELERYLNDSTSSPLERVANAPEISLPDATERARRYWDAREAEQARRSSRPPAKSGKS